MSTPSPTPPTDLLGIKLRPPGIDPSQVMRTAVCDAVCTASSARLILVRAPAGFGKTTAMQQCRQRFESQGITTAWLTLDAADNDPSRFLDHLGTAAAHLLPDDTGALRRAHEASTIGEFALSLIDRLASLTTPFVLFLDDFELIQDPGVLALVREVLERLPHSGRMVVGSRSLPDLRVGRLRARGQLLEVDVQRLRFSIEETRRFFAQRQSLGLGHDELSALHRKTEGWVAALWLAWLALEHNDARGEFIVRFSGADAGVADYLAEDVLAQQTAAVRDFLLRTSVLRELNAPLCEALMTELDSAATLRQLEAANVFLTVVDGKEGSYRYHSLFASFLRAQLKRELPHAMPTLHRAAALWYAGQGRPVPAIDHVLESGDMAWAVQMMNEHAMPLLTQGRMRLLTRWFDALPPRALLDSPMLQVIRVWAVSFTRGPREAMELMQGTKLEQSTETEVMPHVDALRPTLLCFLDRWEDAYVAGQRSLHRLPSGSPFADAALVNATAIAAGTLGRYTEARRLLDTARQTQGQSASAFHRMFSEAIEGIIDLVEGRLRQATARFRLAINTTQASSLGPANGNAWPGLLFAASAYESNELEQAARLLQVYLPLARDVWLPDHTIVGHVLLARVAFTQGEVDPAFQTLSELEYLGHRRQMPRLVASARLERARLQLLQGHADAADIELRRCDEPGLWQDVATRRHFAHDLDDLIIGRLRWQLVAGNARQAEGALAVEIADAKGKSRHRRVMKLKLLRSMALERCGDRGASCSLLQEVLRRGCDEGVVRLIVDEGPLAGVLVRRLHAHQHAADRDPIVAEYLQRLVKAFGPVPADEAVDAVHAPPPVLSEPLTRKEIRLLQLLAEGYSNSALTEKLFVSDSTVRTHLRNINLKLDAHNRTQAVAIGRRLGVIR